MATDTFMQDLSLLVRSRHPIIFIETSEKERVQTLLMHLADSLRMPFFVWTRTKGLKHHFELAVDRSRELLPAGWKAGAGAGEMVVLESPDRATMSPLTALEKAEYEKRPALYNFQGLAADLDEKDVVSKLREAARQFLEHEGSIIITGSAPSDLPNALKGLSTVLSLPLPQLKEYRDLAERIYRDLAKRLPVEYQLTREELRQLVQNLQGLTLLEAEKILTKVMVEDNKLGPDDLSRVMLAKKQIVEQDGLLEYYPSEQGITDIAGLEGLKKWLKKRQAIIKDPAKAQAFGLEFPKGVLLLGVQGSGKSLCAKAIASDWGLPLLKMDPSSLYNKYIGESERNFKRATEVAEKISPVILWIDELEKAFSQSGDADGGLSQRVLGLFLGWLQERKGNVFVVATANDVSKLPPELIRKGRFDEIFFVDLPDKQTRQAILALHLKKRKRNYAAFDLEALAELSEGFSGAELEQAVLSGLYTAFAEGCDLNTEILAAELKQSVPLSVTMSDALLSLRAWAKDRAVPAH